MTLEEFSNEFDILYNNITSNQAPGLDEYEKSVFLTKAQDEILKAYFDPKSNKVGEGFDDSERRQIDFSMLINTFQAEEFPGVSTLYPVSNAKLYSFPSDILMVINESLMVRRGNYVKYLSVIPLNYREYDRLMSKPYKRPIKNQAWRLLTNSVSTVVSHTKPSVPDFSEEEGPDTEATATPSPVLPITTQVDIDNLRMAHSKNISRQFTEDILFTEYIDMYYASIYALGSLYAAKGADLKKAITTINNSSKILILKQDSGYKLQFYFISQWANNAGYVDIKDSNSNIIYFQENDQVFIDAGYENGIDVLYGFVNTLCYPIMQRKEKNDTMYVFKPDQDTDELMRILFNGALFEAVYNGYTSVSQYSYQGDTSVGKTLYDTIDQYHRNYPIYIEDLQSSPDYSSISNYYFADTLVTITDDTIKIGNYPINTKGENNYRFGSGEGLPYIVVPLASYANRSFNVKYNGGASTHSFDSRVYKIAQGYINRYLAWQYSSGNEEDFDYSDSGNNSGGSSGSETETFGKIQIYSNSINIDEGSTYTGKIWLDQPPTNNQVVTVSVNNSNCSINPTTFTFTPDNYNVKQTYQISTEIDNNTITNKASVVTFTTTNNTVNCSVTILNTTEDNTGGSGGEETEILDPSTIIVNDPNHRLSDSTLTVFDLWQLASDGLLITLQNLFTAKNAATKSYGYGYPTFQILTSCYIKISKTTGSTVAENEYRLNAVAPNKLLSGNYDLSQGKFYDLDNNEIVFKENDECIVNIGGIQKLFDLINYINYPLIQINQPNKVVEEFITPNDLHLVYARYKIVENLLLEAGTTFTDTYAAGNLSWTTDSRYAANKQTFTNIVNNISAYYLQNHRSNNNDFTIDSYGGFPYRVCVSTNNTGEINIAQFLTVTGEIKNQHSDRDQVLSNGNFLVIQNLQNTYFSFPYYTKVITGNTIKFNTQTEGGGDSESGVYGNIIVNGYETDFTLNRNEGTTLVFSVQLSKAPSSNQTVTINVNNQYCTLDKYSVTFTPDNYNQPQLLKLTLIEDSNTSDKTSLITFSSPNVNSIVTTINIKDITSSGDTKLGITHTPTQLTIPNLSSSKIYVCLNKQPSEDYIVSTDANTISALSVSPISLTFTPSNWNTPQEFLVSANGSGSYSLELQLKKLSDLSIVSQAYCSITIQGEATFGSIVANKSSIQLESGNSTTIGIALNSAPSEDQRVTAMVSPSLGVTIDQQQLVFTPSKYNQYQYITITANTIGDYILTLTSGYYTKSVPISVTASSSGGDDSGEGGEGSGGSGDNTPTYGNIIVSKSSISVIEGNTTNFTVRLSKAPSSSQTVSINSSSGVSVSPSTLVFNSSNWNTAQTVTVTGIQYGIHSIVLSSKNVSSVTIQSTVVSSSNEGGGGIQDVTITNTYGKGIVEVIPGPNDVIVRYTLRYIKKPIPIILDKLEGVTIEGYIGLNSEGKPTSSTEDAVSGIPCELDPILHKEILQRAVELAKAAYSGGLQEQIVVGNQSSTEKGYLPQSK